MAGFFYVYVLSAVGSDTPFYVGKGSGRRMTDHFRNARLGKCKNKHLQNTILSIWKNGSDVDATMVFETDDVEEAFKFERVLIAQYGRRDIGTGSLVNLTDGGEGIRGCSPATIEKRKKTYASTRETWTSEKRQQNAINQSISQKRRWDCLTPEQVKEKTRHIAEHWSSLSDEEKSEITLKRISTRGDFDTEEWRERIRQKCRSLWNDPEARRLHGELIAARKAQMDPDRKTQHAENVRAAVKDMWAALSVEQRAQRMEPAQAAASRLTAEQRRQSQRRRYENETDEARQFRRQRQREGMAKVDWKAAGRRSADSKKNWSEEEKAKYSEKMRAAARKRWWPKKDGI